MRAAAGRDDGAERAGGALDTCGTSVRQMAGAIVESRVHLQSRARRSGMPGVT